MHVPRTLWIAAVTVAAIVGLLAVAATSPAPGGTDSITVPNGNFGDVVLYEFLWNDDSRWMGNQTSDSGKENWRLAIDGGVAMDQTRSAREVLVLDLEKRRDSGYHARNHLDVDLGTRDVIQHNFSFEKSAWIGGFPNDLGRSLPIRDQGNETLTYYGPRMDPWLDWISLSLLAKDATEAKYPLSLPRNLTFIRFQNETISASQDLTAASSTEFFETLWSRWWNGVEARIDAFEFQSRTGPVVEIDGVPAIGVFTSARVDYTWDFVDYYGTGVYWLNETIWWTQTLPYPFRIVTNETYAETDTETAWLDFYTTDMRLASYQPGSGGIPWRPKAANVPIPPAPILAHSSGIDVAPSDGTLALSLRLADAVKSVESDLTLASFRLWRQEHPTARLAGATYAEDAEAYGMKPTLTGQREPIWYLVYATPSPDAGSVATFRVAAGRDPSTGLIKTNALGEPMEPFPGPLPVEAFPDNPLTLGAARDAWLTVAPAAHRARGVNYVEWGIGIGRNSATYMSQLDGTHGSLGRLLIGVRDFRAEADGSTFPFRDTESVLKINLETGHLIWLSGDESAFGVTPVPVASIGGKPATSNPSAGGLPGEVRLASWAGASLLAFFLTAYLWPLARYAFTEALSLIPGYARLQGSGVLANKVREKLVQAIEADPGITPPQLQRLVGAGWSTIVYHLTVLEKNKLVSSLIDGRHRRFFPKDTINWSDRGRIAALKNERSRALYEMILAHGSMRRADLARASGLTLPGVQWHLERLENAGLVNPDRPGRRANYVAVSPAASFGAQTGIEVA